MDNASTSNSKILAETPPLSSCAAACYLNQMDSLESRKSFAKILNRIAAFLGIPHLIEPDSRYDVRYRRLNWGRLEYADAVSIRGYVVQRGYSPSTANKYIAALRGVANEAFRLGQMPSEQCERIRTIEYVRGKRELTGRFIHSDEIKAQLDACDADSSVRGCRDAAIIAIFIGSGARISELIAPELSDYNPETGRLHLLGKGNKERFIDLSDDVRAKLATWLALRGETPGPLICQIDQRGRIQLKRIGQTGIRNMIRRRTREAGLSEPVTPHDYRRTFISMLLTDHDIVTVQKLAGHASPAETARYDRRGEDLRRKASQSISFSSGKAHTNTTSGTAQGNVHLSRENMSQPEQPRTASIIPSSTDRIQRHANQLLARLHRTKEGSSGGALM